MYPQLTPKEREGIITKKHKTVFIQQIGGKLKSGKPHDGRAPDYDDWSLNGDLLFLARALAVRPGNQQHGHPCGPGKPG